mmetsp:Transcript_6850/g.12891  ORF Transcript_6850/g.12891 Transcript_6850/m.12891 type:complete len:382 (+) Transcript_6850:127-1272(+)
MYLSVVGLPRHVPSCYNKKVVRPFQEACSDGRRFLSGRGLGRHSTMVRATSSAFSGQTKAKTFIMNKDCYVNSSEIGKEVQYFSSASNDNGQKLVSTSSSSVTWQNKKRSKTFGDLESPRMDILSNAPFDKVLDVFPGSYTNGNFLEIVCNILEDEGYDLDKMLLATSFCSDELNRALEITLTNQFNMLFNMGGLAGFPFGGATSFGAMAAHIPEGGSCLIVHGSHVGIDSNGKIGIAERRGRLNGGDCCGSGVAGLKYVSSVFKGEQEEMAMPKDATDAQQYFVGKMLLPFAKQLEESEDKMLELPRALYAGQIDLMKKIIDKSASAVADGGTIALIGGIQINTPPEYTDYFLPMDFNIYDNTGKLLKTIWRAGDVHYQK